MRHILYFVLDTLMSVCTLSHNLIPLHRVCVCVLTVADGKSLPQPVHTVLKQEITRLFGESDPKSYNKNFLSKHSSSIPHRVAGTHLRGGGCRKMCVKKN